MARNRGGSSSRLTRLRLQQWREAGGYSIQRLADRAGVSRMTVFRIESGRSSPTVAVLEKLTRALTIEVRDLFPSARAAHRSTRKGRTLPSLPVRPMLPR